MDRKYKYEMAAALQTPCRICKRDFKYEFEGRIFKNPGICAHEKCIVSVFYIFCTYVRGVCATVLYAQYIAP